MIPYRSIENQTYKLFPVHFEHYWRLRKRRRL